MPTVSVIIPTYNCGPYLGAAIESVLQQTMQDVEIIVVDDGSTDNTPEVVQHYLHRSDIRYIRRHNRGVSAARNAGAAVSRGQFLAFLDADDTLPQHSLAVMADRTCEADAAWCSVNILKVAQTGNYIGITQMPSEELLYGVLREDFFLRAMFMCRDAFFEVGGYDDTLEIREDWDLNIRRISMGMKFVHIPEPLYTYNHREGSLTKAKRSSVLTCTEIVLKKHHKRLADAGDKRVAVLYAANTWDLAREYLFSIRDPLHALALMRESLSYDFNPTRLIRPLSRLRPSSSC